MHLSCDANAKFRLCVCTGTPLLSKRLVLFGSRRRRRRRRLLTCVRVSRLEEGDDRIGIQREWKRNR